MESIAQDIRRGIGWIVGPLALASLVRVALEPSYWGTLYLLWLGALAAFAAIQWRLLAEPSPTRIRGSLLVNFGSISISYSLIGAALRAHPGWRADQLVYAADCALFHGDPQRFLAPLRTPWVSTVAMLGYLGFFAYLIHLLLSEAFTLNPATGRLQLGLMRVYGLGFAGYLLLPAAGPVFDHPQLLGPIHHSAFSAALQPFLLAKCSRVDVCPSVHAAVCAFTLTWTWWRRPRLLPWLILPSAALLLGTVYLQYHYFIDLPFGLLLGTAAALSVTDVQRPTVLAPARAAG